MHYANELVLLKEKACFMPKINKYQPNCMIFFYSLLTVISFLCHRGFRISLVILKKKESKDDFLKLKYIEKVKILRKKSYSNIKKSL